MYSNLCYPPLKGHTKVREISQNELAPILMEMGVVRIANKYVIVAPNGELLYQHDHKTFQIKIIPCQNL